MCDNKTPGPSDLPPIVCCERCGRPDGPFVPVRDGVLCQHCWDWIQRPEVLAAVADDFWRILARAEERGGGLGALTLAFEEYIRR